MSRTPLGITWDASHGRWKATVRRDGKTVHLGHYLRRETALEAARTAREPVMKDYRVTVTLKQQATIPACCPGEAKEMARRWYDNAVATKVLKVTANKVRKESKP